tara:strand:+ start:10283 stop:11866 length:1584 start_codon:yes stop_codon:yes gene_type:complete
MSGFAAGFFGQLNNDITDQKQYIRARVEEDRLYLREQGLKRQGAIQEQRGQFETAARSLINRGADERRVLNFLENNPSGLMELYRRTDSNNDVTGANLNDMLVIGEDYQSEASMDEILNSILPTVQAMPNDTGPVESRRRSIASWLGLDVDEAMTNQVYNEQIVGGMTGDQIMASMNLPVQAEGSGATSATLDLGFLSSANTISVGDANAYYARANGDYNVEAKRDELAASLEGATQDEMTEINANIGILDNMPASGPARLNAIFESGLFTIGANTRDLMSSDLGGQLFGVENFSTAARAVLGIEQTEETPTGDSANPDAALGNPDALEVQAPTESTTRPQARPAQASGAQVASTPTEAIESARVILEADPEATEVLVPFADGTTATVRKDQVPLLSIEESDDRAAFIEALTSDAPNIDEAIYAFMDKYGLDLTRAVQSMAADQTVTAPIAPAPVAPVPGQAPPVVSTQEAIADQQMLQAAIVSEDIEQNELDTIIQNFSDRYGEDAMRTVVDRALNPSTAQSRGGR